MMSQNSSSSQTGAEPGRVTHILDWLDLQVLRAWRVFVSLKFGIFLLALIGALSVYGTMKFSSNAALGDNGISMGRTLFFESRWFVALLLLFALQLAISTAHVTKMSFSIWWKRAFRRGRTFYEHGSSPRAEVAVPGGLDEAQATLRRRFTRVHRDGPALFAHRGLLSRIGPTVIHFGILMVLFSQIIKAMLIWSGSIVTEGRFVAEEGAPAINFISEPVDLAQVMTEMNRRDRAVPYWIRVLDFDEVKHANSDMPAYFSSLVEVRDPKTQTVRVAQLDMNHSLRIGDLQFHQAGFVPVPDNGHARVNFDVRDAATGERLAVTDAGAGTRVRVGGTDLFLEVDGTQPGDHWRLYTRGEPEKVAAEGLLTGTQTTSFHLRPDEFFPDFRIDDEKGQPVNLSNEPNNPALHVTVFEGARELGSTWVFSDPMLARAVPPVSPSFRLELKDIRVRRGSDLAEIDWKDPAAALFQLAVRDSRTDEVTAEPTLGIGEASQPFEFAAAGSEPEKLGTENGYAVRALGPAQRYATILSVVKEPTAFWTMFGVVIVVAGAIMTFSVRYRAFYGWWDPKTDTLRMALVPRWGQSPVQDEFDALVAELSHGAGPVKRLDAPGEPLDEVPPEHESFSPELAVK